MLSTLLTPVLVNAQVLGRQIKNYTNCTCTVKNEKPHGNTLVCQPTGKGTQTVYVYTYDSSGNNITKKTTSPAGTSSFFAPLTQVKIYGEAAVPGFAVSATGATANTYTVSEQVIPRGGTPFVYLMPMVTDGGIQVNWNHNGKIFNDNTCQFDQ